MLITIQRSKHIVALEIFYGVKNALCSRRKYACNYHWLLRVSFPRKIYLVFLRVMTASHTLSLFYFSLLFSLTILSVEVVLQCEWDGGFSFTFFNHCRGISMGIHLLICMGMNTALSIFLNLPNGVALTERLYFLSTILCFFISGGNGFRRRMSPLFIKNLHQKYLISLKKGSNVIAYPAYNEKTICIDIKTQFA